jgi:ABC-type molybdate transport system permease subunit
MENVAALLSKFGALLVVANELRGAVLTAPVLYTMWHTGGDAMRLWLCFCTVAGIVLSVVVPMWAMRRWRRSQMSWT